MLVHERVVTPLVARAPDCEGDGAALGKRDDELASGREIAARRDEPVSFDERESVVDGASLDDAVQVESEAGRASHERADELDLAPAAGGTCGRRRGRVDIGERAVVAGGDERIGDRRIEAPVRRRGGPEGIVERGREHGRDDHRRRQANG